MDAKDLNQQISDEQEKLGFAHAEQLESLLAEVPTAYENPQKGEIVLLTPDAKALVIYYAFLGLAELVAQSAGQTQEFVWRGCIKRAMLNLHKDGLL